jgi:hypothetical protein
MKGAWARLQDRASYWAYKTVLADHFSVDHGRVSSKLGRFASVSCIILLALSVFVEFGLKLGELQSSDRTFNADHSKSTADDPGAPALPPFAVEVRKRDSATGLKDAFLDAQFVKITSKHVVWSGAKRHKVKTAIELQECRIVHTGGHYNRSAFCNINGLNASTGTFENEVYQYTEIEVGPCIANSLPCTTNATELHDAWFGSGIDIDVALWTRERPFRRTNTDGATIQSARWKDGPTARVSNETWKGLETFFNEVQIERQNWRGVPYELETFMQLSWRKELRTGQLPRDRHGNVEEVVKYYLRHSGSVTKEEQRHYSLYDACTSIGGFFSGVALTTIGEIARRWNTRLHRAALSKQAEHSCAAEISAGAEDFIPPEG